MQKIKILASFCHNSITLASQEALSEGRGKLEEVQVEVEGCKLKNLKMTLVIMSEFFFHKF